jgi:hypothetical protein
MPTNHPFGCVAKREHARPGQGDPVSEPKRMSDEDFDALDQAIAEYPECIGPVVAEARRSRAREKRLEEALERVARGPSAGCGCVPVCRCFSPEAVRAWVDLVMDDARAALSEET